MLTRIKSTPLFRFLYRESNFYRIHFTVFTIVPLVASAIFWGVNGEYPVAFIDALFLCYSSMTVTGLSTVNLSTTTPLQQFILFALMWAGDIITVAWVVVLVRKWYIRTECEVVVQKLLPPKRHHRLSMKISSPFGARPLERPVPLTEETSDPQSSSDSKNSEAAPVQIRHASAPYPQRTQSENNIWPRSIDKLGIIDVPALSNSPQLADVELPSSAHTPTTSQHPGVTYAPDLPRGMARRKRAPTGTSRLEPDIVSRRPLDTHVDHLSRLKARDKGLGGLPGPISILSHVAQRITPQSVQLRVRRTFTAPPATTLVPTRTLTLQPGDLERIEEIDNGRKIAGAQWLTSTSVHVGRNSNFQVDDDGELSDEQLEQIGGVEYRALRVLSYLVPAYFLGSHLFAFLLIGPYMSTRYAQVFTAQPRLVNRWWFSIFQIVGAYTGGGLSLVDVGMVPFQKTYIMIIALGFAILAGNHALPIFLRLTIWMWTKFLRDNSPLDVTLHFLLDHPRRCFFYLFPSHQTWYLVVVLVFFSCVEWASFMVLNIGIPTTEIIPVGTRLIDGLFQGLAARASGFAIVSIAGLAPAVQFLYLVMMYIAVFPIAMSIRSTNVYEEQSLGVYLEGPDDEDEEPDLSGVRTRRERLSRYFSWHLHRQVANDIWWLVWGVWLVCIIERSKIDDPNLPWFNIFRICFELVSAFAGVGLSLGLPNNNYSFSGACGPLSKLVIAVIMLRGRHRGLPNALDRSILLPTEFRQVATNADVNEKRPATGRTEGGANGTARNDIPV